MMKLFVSSKKEKGFTLIELLIVAAIIGILIAIAVPNLLGARSSANETNAKKMLQVIRDAEGQFYDQDLDGDGIRDYTNLAKKASADGLFTKDLIDSSLADAVDEDGNKNTASVTVGSSNCKPKSAYCIGVDKREDEGAADYPQDFGWRAARVHNNSGKNAFAVYGDGNIRCGTVGGAAKVYTIVGPDSDACN